MKTFVLILLVSASLFVSAQIPNRFDPSAQNNYKIQYFTPAEDEYYAGDPIPFYHDGTFHVFWLLDTAHHALGLGVHQWAHCSSTDLINWTHHPLAIPLSTKREESIGTGSLFFKDNLYYLYYTTRIKGIPDKAEYASFATSKDGINYTKQEPDRWLTPSSEYSPRDYRDPHIFYDDKSKTYYMIVTTSKANFKYQQNQGCLVYYTSDNMKDWEFKGDFYIPGDAVGFSIPECPTLFQWGEWYYLVYKVSGGTFYRMAKSPSGSWIAPLEDNIGNDYALVHKVAKYKNDRRIAVGMVPSRTDNKDDGAWAYAGNLVFRELFQNEDGTLYSGQVKEMMPDGESVKVESEYQITSNHGFKVQELSDIPANSHIRLTIEPKSDYEQAGMMLRFSESGYYNLLFSPRKKQVTLGNQTISGVYDFDKPFTIDITMQNSIIDVCIEGKRCILNRCPEQKGTDLVLFVRNGDVKFKDIEVMKIDD